jgi:hypothetical protein
MQQLRVLNVHLACLHSAIREKSGIALPLTLVSPSTLIQGDSIAWQSYGTGDDRFVRDSMEPVSRFFRLLHFDIDVLSLSFDLLSDILDKKDQEAIHLTDLHARSFAAWQEEDFALSLILAWAIIERMIQTIWTEHVAANRERIVDGSPITFINKNRREKLAAGRDFTASVISEILSLEELISFSVYESIERARKARNGWLHALVAVGGNDAMTAVSVAETLLKQVKALRLGLALNSVD